MASNWPSFINPCKNTRNDSWSFCSLIGHKKTKVLWHQSEARTTPTVWNWSGKTVSPGAPRFVLYFSSPKFFFRPLRLSLAPTNCPWVSEDEGDQKTVSLNSSPSFILFFMFWLPLLFRHDLNHINNRWLCNGLKLFKFWKRSFKAAQKFFSDFLSPHNLSRGDD